MKILVAGSTFPRTRDDRLPDFMWQQVRHIAALVPGVRAFVLAPHDARAARRETWEGVEIRRFQYVLPARAQRLVYPAIWPNLQRAPWLLIQVPLLLVSEFMATLRWIRRERFAMVYSHWFMPQGVACGLAALVTGTPHAFTSHSSDVAVMRRVPVLGPWLVRTLTRRARAITAVSERSRDIIAGFFSAAEWNSLAPKVAVIPMGIDTRDWRTVGDVPAANEARILFIGRLAEKKGIDYLLDAMTLDPLRESAAELVIAGDGPLRRALEDRVSRLGLGQRVHFAGYVSGDEKRRCFENASVVVVPSIVTDAGDAEGLPVVLLEALAAGRAIVASDASGAPEIGAVDAITIVPEKDSAALARALADVITMTPARRRAVGDEARATAARYDWEVIAHRYARHLHLLPAP